MVERELWMLIHVKKHIAITIITDDDIDNPVLLFRSERDAWKWCISRKHDDYEPVSTKCIIDVELPEIIAGDNRKLDLS